MPWTGRACAGSCSKRKLRPVTSCCSSATSPKPSPILTWRTSGPSEGPICAFRRRAKRRKWRCSGCSTGRSASSLFTPAGPNEARTSSLSWRRPGGGRSALWAQARGCDPAPRARPRQRPAPHQQGKPRRARRARPLAHRRVAAELCSGAERHRGSLARPEAASPRSSDVQRSE
jgi:hypothetical protein